MTPSRPRLLDLYCGAGGAAMGYHRAGFEVVGVDINPQPRYPFEFHQADALTYPLEGFAAIHASPPCQHYSIMSRCRPGLASNYPDLVDITRIRLEASGQPWVIENVPGAPVLKHSSLFDLHGIELCGHMFGLALYRHRHFESNTHLWQPDHPKHLIPGARAGNWKPGEIISVSGNCAPISLARTAMGIDWMTRAELAESIPPAYTEFIGRQLLEAIHDRSAVG